MLTSMLTLMIAFSLFFALVTLIRARGLTLEQDSRGSWVEDLPKSNTRLLHGLLPLLALGYIGYHNATVTPTPILTPSELISSSESIEFRGTVNQISSEGNLHQIEVSDGGRAVVVQFNGTLPRQLRTHWGAHVVGTVAQSDGSTVEAGVLKLKS